MILGGSRAFFIELEVIHSCLLLVVAINFYVVAHLFRFVRLVHGTMPPRAVARSALRPSELDNA